MNSTENWSKSRKRRERKKKLKQHRESSNIHNKHKEPDSVLQYAGDCDLVPFFQASVVWINQFDTESTEHSYHQQINQIISVISEISEENIVNLIVEYSKGPPTSDQFKWFVVDEGYKTIAYKLEFDRLLSLYTTHEHKLKLNWDASTKQDAFDVIMQQTIALLKVFENGLDMKYSYFGIETKIGTWYNWNVQQFVRCATAGFTKSGYDQQRLTEFLELHDNLKWNEITRLYICGQSYE